MPPPGAARRAPASGGPTHRLAALQAAQMLQGFVGGAAGQASLEAEELRRTCQLNAALCLLALGRPADAVAECDAVLRRHPAERKALYRRGLGRLALADAAAAAPDLRAALELCAAALGPPPPVPPPSRLGALSGSSPHSAVHVLGCMLAAPSGVKASFGAGREAAVTAWPASDVMRCRQGARGARPSGRPSASALPHLPSQGLHGQAVWGPSDVPGAEPRRGARPAATAARRSPEAEKPVIQAKLREAEAALAEGQGGAAAPRAAAPDSRLPTSGTGAGGSACTHRRAPGLCFIVGGAACSPAVAALLACTRWSAARPAKGTTAAGDRTTRDFRAAECVPRPTTMWQCAAA